MTLALRDPDLFRVDAYIGGEFVSSILRATVRDPATGDVIAEVARCGKFETRHAIEAADDALPAWRALPARKRADVLHKLAALMEEHVDDLALLLTSEQGKPLAESRGEVRYAASFLTWFAEEAPRVYGDTIPSPVSGTRLMVIPQPVGVCAAITPWNFPSAMITRKLGPALATGCTLVLKPAEATPLSALALAVLSQRAGVPPGVFNVVTGAANDASVIGAVLTSDPRVRKLSFTGSTEVGKLLLRQCASTVKKVSLELGGNAPFIVFDDADLSEAIRGAMTAKFRNAGQTCIAANRILVQDGVHDEFVSALRAEIDKLVVGPGTEPSVTMGPLLERNGFDKVASHVEDACSRGAELIVGGGAHDLGGTFFQPTLLTGVRHGMLMSSEETFGPVAGITRFTSEEEAITLANDTPAGLAAYFYARDVGRVVRVSEALDYGMVGANTGFVSTTVAPFGGMKESGLGREGSKFGIEDWIERKYVALAF